MIGESFPLHEHSACRFHKKGEYYGLPRLLSFKERSILEEVILKGSLQIMWEENIGEP